MVFCNSDGIKNGQKQVCVTILILIDGFLQYDVEQLREILEACHNPYFNRWFSAIIYMFLLLYWVEGVTILILIDGFLQ